MTDRSDEDLSESEIRKKAYLAGMRSKRAGHDGKGIYARLKREKFPEELVKQVVKDLMIEMKRDVIEKANSDFNFALIKIGIGLIGALVSILIFPENHVFPAGILGAGILAALLAKKKINGQ